MFTAIEIYTDLTEKKKAILKNLLTAYRRTAKKLPVEAINPKKAKYFDYWLRTFNKRKGKANLSS